MSKAKLFAANALLMTAAALVMRAIALGFNVYISNKLGSAGMGLFTLILSVYGFAATFAVSGVNLASTRLTAESLGNGSDASIRAGMKACCVYGLCFGFAACVILYALSDPVGTYLLGDSRSAAPLKALALSLPFVSLSSALGGYFNAVRHVGRGVSAQLFGQLVRIAATAFLLTLLLPDGIGYACLAVSAGATVSEAFSCVYLLLLFRADISSRKSGESIPAGNIRARLFSIALPVALSAYVRSGLLTVEHLLIPRGLRSYGASGEDAVASYGVLHGMVMPVVLFPMAMLSSFASLLVPELAEERARGNFARINNIIARVYQLTLIYSIGCAGFMIAFSGALGLCLYGNAEASSLIALISPLIPVMYVDHVTDGMLKGMGEQLYSMKVNIADSLLSCILVWLWLPHSGIRGYIAIIFITELFNTALSVVRLMSVAEVRVKLIRWLLLPLLCVGGSTSLVNIAASCTHICDGSTAFDIIVRGICAVALYIVFLLLTTALTRADLSWIAGILHGSPTKKKNEAAKKNTASLMCIIN